MIHVHKKCLLGLALFMQPEPRQKALARLEPLLTLLLDSASKLDFIFYYFYKQVYNYVNKMIFKILP